MCSLWLLVRLCGKCESVDVKYILYTEKVCHRWHTGTHAHKGLEWENRIHLYVCISFLLIFNDLSIILNSQFFNERYNAAAVATLAATVELYVCILEERLLSLMLRVFS